MGLKMIVFQNGKKLVVSKYQWEELKKGGDEGGWEIGREEEIAEGGGKEKWEGAGKER